MIVPVIEGSLRNGEARRDNLTVAARAASRARPRKECDDRSRRADAIAKVKVIRRRVVEINCSFNKAKSENLPVKIEIALRIARDGGDVMNAKKFHTSVIVAALMLSAESK